MTDARWFSKIEEQSNGWYFKDAEQLNPNNDKITIHTFSSDAFGNEITFTLEELSNNLYKISDEGLTIWNLTINQIPIDYELLIAILGLQLNKNLFIATDLINTSGKIELFLKSPDGMNQALNIMCQLLVTVSNSLRALHITKKKVNNS